MERNQKGFSNIFIAVAIIIALAVAGLYLSRGRTTTPWSYPNQQINTTQTIQADSDLQNASQDLDNTAVDGTFDPQLNQNDTDASNF